VARPLREQLAVATVVLLVPVSAVMTWAAGTTYRDQIDRLNEEARTLATAIAKHIELMEPDPTRRLDEYLAAIDVPDGTELTVASADGYVVARHARAATENVGELAHMGAQVATRPWTVGVGIPTQVAWGRAEANYRRTIAISGIATLILLVVEAVFIRRWLPALVRLERLVDRVGAGDLSTPAADPMPSSELERLRDAFREMIGRLRTARDDIAQQVEEERRIRQELESLQQQIIRQERLAAIGVLLSGIAHELNNPLQAISGFSEILQRNTGLPADVRDDLAIIQKESRRASAIIRNVSRFSRQQTARPSAVVLADLIASVIELRQRRLQEQGIAIEVDDAATRPVRAVFTELQQVLLNFLINAEQAINAAAPPVRRIVIRSRDAGDRVRLEVEDTGPGVAPEDESKLFQPFFTTKPIGEGTGLGLSVSYGIARAHGGTIGYARGALGGALFHVEIPAATSS
jgi:C4-dicarboxylate-specific signal transduction histidine kinase